MFLLLAVFLSLCRSPASCFAGDFLPLEPGNRWIYVHEIVDGSFVGDYALDTCAVEVTESSIARGPGGTDFAAALVLGLPFSFAGSPCWAERPHEGDADMLAMHKDTQGHILWRPKEPRCCVARPLSG